MNPNLKRFLVIFALAAIIHFVLFYFLEEDRNCVFEWGSKCSNSFFIRTSFQVIFMSILFFYLGRKKKIDKQ